MNPLVDDWAAVLLDGLVGALLGAGATIAVVAWTIRNEASLRRRDRLDDAVATAHADAMTFGFLIQNDNKINDHDTTAALYRMLQTYITATARAQHLEPKLHELLDHVSDEITETLQAFDGSSACVQQLRRTCFLAQAALARWVTNPEEVRKGKISLDALRSAADPTLPDPSK